MRGHAPGWNIQLFSACRKWLGQQKREIHSIDAKWRDRWAASSPEPEISPRNTKNSQAPKYYQLPMFPYPSGRLHIGHLRVYTISDALARFRRMQGYNVVHPIGWDAFGLPAENAAIENGISAADWTYKHIDVMREQLKRMMVSFDWAREVITCAPDYYKHTQQIFLSLYKRGLAYRASAMVNWDPVDKTVLANEQIDSQGRSWRSGAIAEQRELEQWFIKITAYAKELRDDLQLLENWPDSVKRMQHQWIGLSEGVEIKFGEGIWAFTTKLETLAGVKFLAISEDHYFAKKHAASTTVTGLVEGLEASHPLTGEPIPVYVTPYVVSDYGSGVVMGVPAHDKRDREFWGQVKSKKPEDFEPVIENGKVVSGPSQFVGLAVDKARSALLHALESEGRGRAVMHSRIRDWLVSRQRFWGAPVPMVHCAECGVVPVPESELPVLLPDDTRNVPLSEHHEWLETKCPECGSTAHRDPDTMDTFMDSSWYFLRYLDPGNVEKPFDPSATVGKLPVDTYVGGVEHAILHLLYSRFLAKFLARDGQWDGGDLNGEPFRRLVTQGMVHGRTFREKSTGRYLKPEEIKQVEREQQQGLNTMDNYEVSMEKMSKSKYNGVDPLDVIEAHGVDATRAHMLFQAPIEDTLDWDDAKIVGVERWLAKVSKLGAQLSGVPVAVLPSERPEEAIGRWNQAANLLQNITDSFANTLSLNTVISDYMKLTKCTSDIAKSDQPLAVKAYEVLLKAVAPVCPAHAEELWERHLISQKKAWTSIHDEKWPEMSRIAHRIREVGFKVILNSRPLEKPVLASPGASQKELVSQVDLSGKKITRVVFKPNSKLLIIVTD